MKAQLRQRSACNLEWCPGQIDGIGLELEILKYDRASRKIQALAVKSFEVLGEQLPQEARKHGLDTPSLQYHSEAAAATQRRTEAAGALICLSAASSKPFTVHV
jgi:hypothetical protein